MKSLFTVRWPAVITCVSLLLFGVNATAKVLSDQDCYVDGISTKVRCVTLSVPEDPQKPQARQITLNVKILPGYSYDPQPYPLLILAGGPGQAATEQIASINTIFKPVRQHRDIVMIDQRGTGGSNGLHCTNMDEEGLALDMDVAAMDLVAKGKECLALFEQTDLRQYSTAQAVDDFELVRKALGYQKFHLYGGSYGTRSGLVYLRRHPQSIASAVLDSVAPTQLAIGLFGKTAQQAFELLLQNCRENARCDETFPTLKQDFVALVARLDEPLKVKVTDPVSAQQTTLLFDRSKLLNLLRTALYSVQTRQLLPLVIQQAARGNYKPFLGLYGAISKGAGLYTGLSLTVVCSEDWPRISQSALAADDANYVVANVASRYWRELCPIWPKYPVDDAFAEPVRSDVPTLLLSGRLDPVTPPEYGEMALQTLSNARHLVAHNGAHTIATHTCASRLIAEFLEHGQLEKLDEGCLQQKRTVPFMLNANRNSF